MAEAYRRGRGRKKIILPSGEDVFIPVLTSISVIDPRDRFQEHQFSIDNSDKADRAVHVDTVHPTDVNADGVPLDDPPSQDRSGNGLKVERIDTWKVIDPRSRYQESQIAFDNTTGADSAPPRFTTHQKTSVYRYYKDPNNPDDSGPWIDSELIDELGHVDPRSRYQEAALSLNNPSNAEFRGGDLSGQASADDPDITIGDGEGTADNPIRTDPFQNIINFNDTAPPFILLGFGGEISYTWASPPTDTGVPATDPAPGPYAQSPWPPGSSGEGWQSVANYVASIDWECGLAASTAGPANGPIVDPLTITQTPDVWTLYNWLSNVATANPQVVLTTGSPLIIDGREITGYLDTLIYKWAFKYFVELVNEGDYYAVAGFPGHWWQSHNAVVLGTWDGSSIFNPTETINSGEQSATVSGDPFLYTGMFGKTSWWKAVGLLDPAILYPREASNPDSPYYVPGFRDYGDIYCIKATPP